MTIAIALEYLHERLRCDFDSGLLYWRGHDSMTPQWNGRYGGRYAFTSANGSGYLMGRILRAPLLAHRVIWAMAHSEWPSGEIDHINGVRTDNRLSNLRAIDRAENARNLKKNSRNKSGFPGVSWSERYGKWVAQIGDRGVRYLGRYDKIEDAIAARKAAESDIGYHANHGRAGQ